MKRWILCVLCALCVCSTLCGTSPEFDRLLRVRVQEKLLNGFRKPYDRIGIEVSQGQVTLRGTVQSVQESSELEQGILKMDGVKTVKNYLKVETPRHEI